MFLDDLGGHKYGCFIGNLFIGALAYADDIVLLAPSRNALKEMLRRANNVSSQYDIHFNTSKSKVVIFTADRKFNSEEIIECNDVSIKALWAADHLGNTLTLYELKQGCGEMHTGFYYQCERSYCLFLVCANRC